MLISTMRSMKDHADIMQGFEEIEKLIHEVNEENITMQQYLFRLIQLREQWKDNKIQGTKITQLINQVRQWIN